MKKKILIILFMIILLTGCVRKINKNEYEKYLINTYGNLNFQHVDIGSCNWFNVGSCTYYFTSEELNGKTFYIHGSFGPKDTKVFQDTYIKTKYDEKLKKYYNKYLKSMLKNGIKIKSINIENKYNIPNMSFDDYLQYLNDKNIEIILTLNIKLDDNNKYFNIKVKNDVAYEELEKAKQELTKFIYKNYDIGSLKKEAKDNIISNNLNNVNKISINFEDCKKDVYYASCSQTIELYNK